MVTKRFKETAGKGEVELKSFSNIAENENQANHQINYSMYQTEEVSKNVDDLSRTDDSLLREEKSVHCSDSRMSGNAKDGIDRQLDLDLSKSPDFNVSKEDKVNHCVDRQSFKNENDGVDKNLEQQLNETVANNGLETTLNHTEEKVCPTLSLNGTDLALKTCIKAQSPITRKETDVDNADKKHDFVEIELGVGETVNKGGTDENSSQIESVWKPRIKLVLKVLAVLSILAYLVLAFWWNFEKAIPVLVVSVFVLLCILWTIWKKVRSRSKRLISCTESCIGSWQNVSGKFDFVLGRKYAKIVCYLFVLLCMLTYAVVKNYNNLTNLQPALGIFVFVVSSWCMSYNRRKVIWRPVIWGLTLQMVLGLLVLNTDTGASTFTFLGHQMEMFLEHVLAGVLFVFGEKYDVYFFIFKLMPTVIFLSSVIAVLYHIGAMQAIIHVIAKVMTFTLGTTAAESTGTAACIFLGQPEASFTIRPYLSLMTRSELFAILTAGFASVTADVFTLFVHYGMPSSHIITAVLMSAPAGMAIAKIICPETEVSRTKTIDRKMDKEHKANNVVDAAARGAQEAVSIIGAIIATIIAFLSILSFVNGVIGYLGSLVNVEGLTLDVILSYPLMPVVFVMGVPWVDCRVIGEVVGLKTFVNELVAYQRLAELVKQGRVVSKRSEIIAMYALCGFSNPTTVGVSLGGLSAMAPDKRKVFAQLILMAWFAGSLACFMTASWAGLLYVDQNDDWASINTTLATMIYSSTAMNDSTLSTISVSVE